MVQWTCEEGFSLLESRYGWQWQETGASGWSQIYKTRDEALAAIDTTFVTITLKWSEKCG